TGAADFYIGTNNSGTAPLQGIIQRVIVRSTIGGAAILDVNLPVDIDTSSDPDAGQTSFTCTTGQTVTVNRATSGLVTAIVTRPVALLDGIATYVQLPADAPTPTATRAAGKHTAVFLLRKSATGANFDRFLSFETGTGVDGCYLTQVGNQTAVYIGDGASSVSSLLTSTIPDNDLAVIGFVIDTGTIAAYYYGEGLATPTSFSGLASDPTFTAGRIGARGYAVQSLAELEFFDVVTFQDQAKTEAQLDVIAAKLLAGTYA
ncbi:MAG: hypothetical protein GY925_16845, partial [Actinomycetia bacterium]|nr:hypothetical protein [Actinomycetes bacterium]